MTISTSTNCRLSYLNYVQYADTLITASTAATSLPAPNVKGTSPYSDFWQSTSTTAQLTIDWGSDLPVDDIALVGLTMTAGDTIRLRLSDEAHGASSGNKLDTGVYDPDVVSWYDAVFYPLAATLSARYLRVNFVFNSMADQGFGRCGGVWVGPSLLPDVGVPVGSYADDWVDVSEVSTAKYSGKKYVLPLPAMRAVSFGLAALSETEMAFVKDLKRLCGVRAPVLFIRDPTRATLNQEGIIGLIEKTEPLMIPSSGALYAWASRIVQNI